MSRSPSAAAKRSRRLKNCPRTGVPSRRWCSRPRKLPIRSGARPGATTSKPIVILRIGCLAAAVISAMARLSICKSPPAKWRRWCKVRRCMRLRSSSARWRRSGGKYSRHAAPAKSPICSICCKVGSRRRSSPTSPRWTRACSRRRKKSDLAAPVPIGRTCANTSPRCSTASARGLTRSLSFFSFCAGWIWRSCSPPPAPPLPCPLAAQWHRARASKRLPSARFLGWR